jgi:hypothetical protein
MVYLTVWYNGSKIMPKNYQTLFVNYDFDNMADYPTTVFDDANKRIRVDEENMLIKVYFYTDGANDTLVKVTEPGLLFVQASSYNYTGNTSKYIEQNKEHIDVYLGDLTYNIFGVITAPNVDQSVDMEDLITITANGQEFKPDNVRVAVNNVPNADVGGGAWEFYILGLEDQTTGDVKVAIGDYEIYKPYKIEKKDIGTWNFYIPAADVLPANYVEDPAMLIDVKMDKLVMEVEINENYQETIEGAVLNEDTKKLQPNGVQIAKDADGTYKFNYGQNLAITVTKKDAGEVVPDLIVMVNGVVVIEKLVDNTGTYCMASVTEDLYVYADKPPVYTKDLLVTIGQKDQNVVVVFTALDDLEEVKDANNQVIKEEKTIPTMTVTLQLNFWYYNEFDDVTPEEYTFSVEYTEKVNEGAAFVFSEDDFATEIDKLGSEYKDAYKNAYAVTGSYVFGDETFALSKTAYKPVTAPAPALEA